MHGLLGADDLSPGVAVQTHITQVLARVGVQRVVVGSGAVFDPAVCAAVSMVITDDPARFERVAEDGAPGLAVTRYGVRVPAGVGVGRRVGWVGSGGCAPEQRW